MPTPVARRPVAGSSALLAPSAQAPKRGERAFETFKEAFKAGTPPIAWQQLRQLARSLYGAEAFGAAPVAGEKYRRLSLSPAQLRDLAAHPQKVSNHVRRLAESGVLKPDTGSWSSSDLAKVATRTARQIVGGRDNATTFTVATVNDDFTDKKTNLKGIKADVMLVQEAKNTNIRRALSDKHGVHQNVRHDDKAGSAVVWKRGEVKAGDRGYALGVEPRGAGMLRRWISWSDVKIDGQQVRMISVHRPPKRFAHLWPAFDANLAKFVKSTRGPVVVGLDANQRDPRGLARATGLKWQAPKGSIDGFLVSPGITVEKMWRLPKGTSDHHPVMARLRMSHK